MKENKRPWNNYDKRAYEDIFKVQRKPNPFKQSIVAILVVVICLILILLLSGCTPLFKPLN